MAPTPRPTDDRFWEKVLIGETCWEWTACVNNHGYGKFGGPGGMRGRTLYAHRYAYETLVGPVPDGLFVCHHCDNPRCVRPGHLFLGTQKDNMHDASKKGRVVHGEQHWRYSSWS